MNAVELPPDMQSGIRLVKGTSVFRALAPLARFRGYDLAAAAVYLMLRCPHPIAEIQFPQQVYWPLARYTHVTQGLVYGNLRTFLFAAARRMPDQVTHIMGTDGPFSLQVFLSALCHLVQRELTLTDSP